MDKREARPGSAYASRLEVSEFYEATLGCSAYDVMDQFHSEQELASTVVLIPVAAEQEASNILPAMEQYALQRDHEPFSICLLLNNRSCSPKNDAIQQTMEEVRTAQHRFKDTLDIRVAYREYDDPIIGAIRKDLWDGAFLLARQEGGLNNFGREVIGINHDIDVIEMPKHYMRNVQRGYQRISRHTEPDRPTPSAFTQIHHYYPLKEYPNTSGGMFWYDLSVRQTYGLRGYEAGLVIPFSYYAAKSGFNPNKRTYETESLGSKCGLTIPRTGMTTSPRRYLERFPEYGYERLWSDETFTHNDKCRENTTHPLDATIEQLESHVLDTLPEQTSNFMWGAAQRCIREFVGASIQTVTATRVREYLERGESITKGNLSQSLAMATRALTMVNLGHITASLPGIFSSSGEAGQKIIEYVRDTQEICYSDASFSIAIKPTK